MQKTWREALLYGLGFVVGALVMSAASFVLVRTSYAGVTDEGAVQAGVAAFPDYLRRVARAVALLGAAEVLALFAVTSGLAAWVGGAPHPADATRESDWPARAGKSTHAAGTGFTLAHFAGWLGAAIFVQSIFWGAEARRHPGLSLPILSAASPVAAVWLAASRFLWPAVLIASALGWARFATRTRRPADALMGACGAIAATAWLSVFELRELPFAGTS